MKTDRYYPATKKQLKQLANLGYKGSTEGLTIQQANRIANSLIQPGKNNP